MKPSRFIIIDDDRQDISLSKLYIKHALPGMQIVDFVMPEQGFDYIKTSFNTGNPIQSVLFLDLNMPTMTGWEFLEKYEMLDEKIKDQICVYITSSSIDSRDTDRAAANKNIKGYLVKPTTVAVIKKLYEECV